MSADPCIENISALAVAVHEMEDAAPTLKHGTCRNCGKPLVFKPFFLDGKQPNPPIWFHPHSGRTCSTRPADWPKDGWPCADPIDDKEGATR